MKLSELLLLDAEFWDVSYTGHSEEIVPAKYDNLIVDEVTHWGGSYNFAASQETLTTMSLLIAAAIEGTEYDNDILF